MASRETAGVEDPRFNTERQDSTISYDLKDEKNPHMKSELEIFQTLVGIRFLAKGGGERVDAEKPVAPANPLYDIFRPSKTTRNRFRNRGLYDRALSQDLKNRVMYTISNYIVTGLYVFQIVIAATITALAASAGASTVALTVLGALNTVVAGLLAWLSGQGLPVRFRSARDQYREVVRAIEKTERMFAEIEYIAWPHGQRPDPMKERDKLEEMYEEARKDQEANYPETQLHPSTNERSEKQRDKYQELQDKVGKKKAQKQANKNEMDAMRKELETLRSSVSNSVSYPNHG